jgi:hypothetical protein
MQNYRNNSTSKGLVAVGIGGGEGDPLKRLEVEERR